MSVLELNHVSKSFGGVKAVIDFSMTAEKRQIVGIIGPNGAGKTTIFNLISGIYTADQGQIVLGGADVTKRQQHEITRLGLARTFQNIRLFRGLTCSENVMTARDQYTRYTLAEGMLIGPRKAREEKKTREDCLQYLKRTGMAAYADERPENLSYGLQRRLEIARALACHPQVLLLDEPAAGLNPREVCDLTDLIVGLRDELGITILLIEHRLEVVMTISDVIYVQNFGQTIAIGSPHEVQRDEKVISAYLGEDN